MSNPQTPEDLRTKVIAVLEHKTLDEDAAFELIDGYYKDLRRADMEAVRKRIRSYVSELTSTDEEADIDGVMRCVNAAITNEEERLNA